MTYPHLNIRGRVATSCHLLDVSRVCFLKKKMQFAFQIPFVNLVSLNSKWSLRPRENISLNFSLTTKKARINEIANETALSNDDQARYLAELLVADYGTHYTNRNGYGSMASADIYIDASYTNKQQNRSELIMNSKKFINKYFNHNSTIYCV